MISARSPQLRRSPIARRHIAARVRDCQAGPRSRFRLQAPDRLLRCDHRRRATGLPVNATVPHPIFITAQLDPANPTGSVSLQLEDSLLNLPIFPISTAAFFSTGFTQAQLLIGSWLGGFSPAEFAGGSIGGGGLAVFNFRMSLSPLERSARGRPAVPTPATGAALLSGFAVAAPLPSS